MKNYLKYFPLFFLFGACCPDDSENPTGADKVLMLKVDYLTNTFESGKEITLQNAAETFTIDVDYQAPGDFGGIQLYYDETDEKLFDGTIHWMGLGAVSYPENFVPANQFEHVITNDYMTPEGGFEYIFQPYNPENNYDAMWSSVQGLTRVRQYLLTSQHAVKIFLYTPSVGEGNPADWDWIIIMKN